MRLTTFRHDESPFVEAKQRGQLILAVLQFLCDREGFSPCRVAFGLTTLRMDQRGAQSRTQLHFLVWVTSRARGDHTQSLLNAFGPLLHERELDPDRHHGHRELSTDCKISTG